MSSLLPLPKVVWVGTALALSWIVVICVLIVLEPRSGRPSVDELAGATERALRSGDADAFSTLVNPSAGSDYAAQYLATAPQDPQLVTRVEDIEDLTVIVARARSERGLTCTSWRVQRLEKRYVLNPSVLSTPDLCQ